MNVEKAKKFIKKNEGTGPVVNGRHKTYFCSSGKMTIGYGRNIEDIGISAEEAEFLLHNDIILCEKFLKNTFSSFDYFSSARKTALLDMRFNLGPTRFIGFKKMIKAIHNGDWKKAAQEAMLSNWYKQVGDRSVKVVDMILTGK